MVNFPKFPKLFSAVIFAPFALAFAGCGAKNVPASAETKFEVPLDGKRLSVRLALTDPERERGLMFCEKLGENEGMIFVYSTEDSRSFWMMNVPINLSIGYFDAAGRLLETHEMSAHDLTGVRSRSDCVQYCLEMREGWFRENGVEPGAQLDLRALEKAVRARKLRP